MNLKVGLEHHPDAYQWIEKYRPVEVVGKSMRLYYVPVGE